MEDTGTVAGFQWSTARQTGSWRASVRRRFWGRRCTSVFRGVCGPGSRRIALLLRSRVKWFDAQKGYGFIRRDGESDVFVHYSAILEEGYRTLNDGEEVEYEIVETDRGPQARNVRRLQKQEAAQQEE
jgi:CspA family cold shock protein